MGGNSIEMKKSKLVNAEQALKQVVAEKAGAFLTKHYYQTEFNIPEDVWVLHGKQYNLTSFADRHPGGKEMLMLGRGRDCTELFESAHAMCSDKPHQLLSKYQVKPNPNASESDLSDDTVVDTSACLYEENGFYSVLKQRVKKHFEENNLSYKADWTFYVKSLVLLLITATTFIKGFYGGSLAYVLISGFVSMMFYFCTLHDGSHFGVSHKVWVNSVFNGIQYWVFWDPWTWARHHVYGHHSFTGIFGRDPDIVNAVEYTRKHEDVPAKAVHAYQTIFGWLFMMILPNQQLGQVFKYAESVFTHEIFGIKLEYKPWDPIKAVMYTLSLTAHIFLPLYYLPGSQVFYLNAVYWIAMGAAYFFVIFPNHDTDSVVESMVKSGVKVDFGELQVRHSGNHSNGNSFISRAVTLLFGGMNFQIEHHLFPSMCHIHYPTIAPIVQQTCKEFNIPYNAKTNWIEAIKGHHAFLHHHKILIV